MYPAPDSSYAFLLPTFSGCAAPVPQSHEQESWSRRDSESPSPPITVTLSDSPLNVGVIRAGQGDPHR